MNERNADTIQKGDIIRSSRFQFGHDGVWGDKNGLAAVGSLEPYRVPDFDRSDLTRDRALFVVEQVKMQGGIYGWTDGQNVIARRLHQDGTYDPAGELIGFYMSGDFAEEELIPEVELRGSMTL